MGDGSFNLFAGGNREAVTLLRAKIRQLRIEIILGTETSCAEEAAALS